MDGVVFKLLRLLAPVILFSILPVATIADTQEKTVQILEVFVRDGCPHCAEAKQYLPQLARERPQLRIVYRSLDTEPQARKDLITLTRGAGKWPPGVPTFVIDGRVLVGFVSEEVTGPKLVALVEGKAIPNTKADTSPPADLSVANLGLPLFTVTLGLIDGLNPCAMWVLLFLLSLLVRLQDRKRMAIIAGTFVLVSGAVYYAFMAAWLNVFLLVGFSNLLRWILACVALAIGALNVRDFIRVEHGFSLSIPESAKPGLYLRIREILRADTLLSSLIGVAILALVVNFIELLCTAGLPAVYTAVLTQQGLSGPAYYGYLGLYILAYIADDALMVTLAVLALGSHRLSERVGRWLKLLSGGAMLMLGGIMLLFPQWLL